MKLTPEQVAEIRQVRLEQKTTRRNCAPALEKILYEPIKVLDSGFIRVVDYMGDDSSIVQAARVSYGTGTKKTQEDRGLINYLMRRRHTTPFEMCEIKFHVKLPIFVARQWIRHRTANVNEYSARYSILDKEFYLPDRKHIKSLREEIKAKDTKKKSKQVDLFSKPLPKAEAEIAAQSTKNKQGREGSLKEDEIMGAIKILKSSSIRAHTHYLNLLNDKDSKKFNEKKTGIARELARIILPTNFYTQWYWKIDLHNLLHFLSLRADSHAQYEIRVYAEAICDVVEKWVPLTYEAFLRYRTGGAHLSAADLDVTKRLIAGATADEAMRKESGLSKREWRELMELLERPE